MWFIWYLIFMQVNLHSNMVLFKWSWSLALSLALYYLHSNMVLFKSNADIKGKITSHEFTFQYGSIQMAWKDFKKFFSDIFTFQYGSIQIPTIFGSNGGNLNLHSNMVLFKFREY